MNLLRKLSLFAAFALGALSLRAQTVIDLSAYIDEDTAAQARREQRCGAPQ